MIVDVNMSYFAVFVCICIGAPMTCGAAMQTYNTCRLQNASYTGALVAMLIQTIENLIFSGKFHPFFFLSPYSRCHLQMQYKRKACLFAFRLSVCRIFRIVHTIHFGVKQKFGVFDEFSKYIFNCRSQLCHAWPGLADCFHC